MLDAITKSLASIEDSSTFATRVRDTPTNLSLEVKGVGNIPFPISATRARKLVKVAKQARYGQGEETILDIEVRDTWEIARSRVKIDKRLWNKTLHPQLTQIQENLGLPSDGKLKAELYKMLVYEPGQFFSPHQDSEKTTDMVGILTVELPSDYRGGTTNVELNGQKAVFRRSKKNSESLTFTAFYSDCHHEVKPITSGYRIVLVYNLVFAGVELKLDRGGSKEDILRAQIIEYFSTPSPVSEYSREPPVPPDKLVYLLDHEYSQKSLRWEKLKGVDRLRATALHGFAAQDDYDIFLTQADVYEVWACDPGYGYGYQNQWRGNRTLGRENVLPAVTDIIDDNVSLQTWIDASGAPMETINLRVSSNELCFTKASRDCSPFESAHEGYTGNAGNTVEYWYHRAAIVMWPTEKSLVIRGQADPVWAMQTVANALKNKDGGDANKMVRELLPRWAVSAGQTDEKSFLGEVLNVATKLNDSTLALQLLGIGKLGQMSKSCIPVLCSLVSSYGFLWGQEVVQKWSTNTCRYSGTLEQSWLRLLPSLCQNLNKSGDDGASLATWIVEHQWSNVKTHCTHLLQNSMSLPSASELENLSKTIVDILDANNSDKSIRNKVFQFVLDPEMLFPLTTLVSCLRHAQESRSPKALKALKLRPLLKHCHDKLASALASKPRSSDDWSINPPPGCPAPLKHFLASSTENQLSWPLAKQGRRNVHGIIDGHKLPVKHTTLRKGSPYKLILEKTAAVFSLGRQERAQQAAELQWIEAFGHRF